MHISSYLVSRKTSVLSLDLFRDNSSLKVLLAHQPHSEAPSQSGSNNEQRV